MEGNRGKGQLVGWSERKCLKTSAYVREQKESRELRVGGWMLRINC